MLICTLQVKYKHSNKFNGQRGYFARHKNIFKRKTKHLLKQQWSSGAVPMEIINLIIVSS